MNQTGKFKATRKCDAFFKKQNDQGLALGFGDIRLRTGYSDVLPAETDLSCSFSRNIHLNVPIISSPMDTVTEAKMAIAMAKVGGLGIIHKNLTPEEQAAQVAKVKHHLNGFIGDPICVKGTDKVGDILRMKERKDYGFSSFPVVDKDNRLVGIVTSNDFEFCDDPENKTIFEIMSSDVTTSEQVDVRGAYQTMQEKHKKILPITDRSGLLSGIYTWKDVKRIITNNSSNFSLDKNGSLLVGASIGVSDEEKLRAELLAEKGVDVFVIDTAHGDSKRVMKMVKFLNKRFSGIDIVAGNISEGESAKRLLDAGVHGIRVGQGPGSICTTRIISGIGHPQVSAIYECALAVRGYDIPICADGGIEYPGDITVALGAGANTVMLGKLLAGTTESPGSVIYRNGKAVKVYRGMGSLGAMLDNKASRERYGQIGNTSDKLVPEGVEAEIAFKGEVGNVLFQLIGGLRSGMGYVGAHSLLELKEKADFCRMSTSGLAESHPHGLDYVKDAPNYTYTR